MKITGYYFIHPKEITNYISGKQRNSENVWQIQRWSRADSRMKIMNINARDVLFMKLHVRTEQLKSLAIRQLIPKQVNLKNCTDTLYLSSFIVHNSAIFVLIALPYRCYYDVAVIWTSHFWQIKAYKSFKQTGRKLIMGIKD